jgi:NADP-dependent 3-hydroxy acid dehydrogenase YdfG
MQIVEGQTAVVTGAASGIGFAVCEMLAARGVRLVMADINEELLKESASLIAKAVAPVIYPCDVSRREQVGALRDLALGRFGQIDLLFNNAGVVLPFKPMWEHDPNDWEWLLGINLWGVIYGIHAFVPDMVARNSGHIVNTASMAGVSILPFNGVYNASKHAVVSLTETLAGELAQRAPNVRATVVCPGLVATRIAPRGSKPTDVTRAAVAPDSERNIMTAAAAAKRILLGVEADEIYVFTNPGSCERIVSRFSGIREALKHDI